MTIMPARLRLIFAGLALIATASIAQAQGTQNRATSLQLSNDQPIQIESDKLEVFDNDRKAIFSGNVNVVQGETSMKAGQMTVHYRAQATAGKSEPQEGSTAGAASSDIERIEVDGKVYVKSQKQVATGDRATFDMNSEVLVMSGKEVVLTEGENVIIGCKLTVQMKNGQAKLDSCESGRVRMSLQPGSQNKK